MFPDVVLLHFNANKYNAVFPSRKEDIINSYWDNVYISRDNISFLDAFERLYPGRSNIFGYLRIFRNLPNLIFTVYEDGQVCSSNDGQWLLTLEERGKCLAIPRTTYLARQHSASENFRNWNIRGEANLITETQGRRKSLNIEMPTISNYFNEIYVAAESTYLSQLNWEIERKEVCFFNFGYSDTQEKKLRELFFDHSIYFDATDREYDYSFIRIKQDSTKELILDILSKSSGMVNLFCDNTHLQQNNRSGENILENIKADIGKKYEYYWNLQDNRSIIYLFSKKNNEDMRKTLLQGYEETPISIRPRISHSNEAFFSFIEGPRVTINGDKDAEYSIRFIDNDTGNIIFTTSIRNNHWAACSVKFSMNWLIEIYENGALWKSHMFNPEGQRVYIHLDSSSLGDSLAWVPYADEYRKKKNCIVILSTHRNELFEDQYPDITFVKPGSVVDDLYAMFGIGWYYNNNEVDKYKNPYDFKLYPLQQTASDILNIEHSEVRPRIKIKDKLRTIPGVKPYVCIAPHASALAKYWNFPGGWQGLINYLKGIGYDVVMITQEPLGDVWHDSKLGGKLTGVINKTGDLPLDDRINDLKHAKAFIGVGSGLSWVAWAVGVPVVMISGFSEEWTEFQDNCVRVINDKSCHGCFNRSKLDPADWSWCPDHKGSDRQFECTKSIPILSVIEAFDKIK